jgi:hypothetical protein
MKPVSLTRYNQPKEAVFVVKPEVQNDIYNLYCADGSLVGIAYIPDYTTSVMMNNLFRIIKENNNLDALEESDDEEEFQNENTDRFVHLSKSYKMVCAFNYKFKKWYPLRIADETAQVSTSTLSTSTFQKGGAKPMYAKSDSSTLSTFQKGGAKPMYAKSDRSTLSTFQKGGAKPMYAKSDRSTFHNKFGSTFSKGGFPKGG